MSDFADYVRQQAAQGERNKAEARDRQARREQAAEDARREGNEVFAVEILNPMREAAKAFGSHVPAKLVDKSDASRNEAVLHIGPEGGRRSFELSVMRYADGRYILQTSMRPQNQPPASVVVQRAEIANALQDFLRDITDRWFKTGTYAPR